MLNGLQSEIWFIISIICLVIEIFAGLTIAFLFLALSSFFTGILINYNILSNISLIYQLACFFGIATLLSIFAYKPLLRFLKKHPKNEFKNIIGSSAIVTQESLIPGRVGHVTWSGSIFKAILEDNHSNKSVSVGSSVTIVAVKENIFIVKSI